MISPISGNPTISLFSYGLRNEEDVLPPVDDKAAEDEAAIEGEENNGELTAEEEHIVAELKKTDARVRQHEATHMAAGGSLVTSGASYTYETGPDGARYAVGGEVGIDTSSGRTPEETVQKARRIRAAALAPADPSPQDRSVAAMASQMEMRALQEIAQQKMEESRSGGESGAASGKASGISENVMALALKAYKSMSGMGKLPGNLGGLPGGVSAYA